MQRRGMLQSEPVDLIRSSVFKVALGKELLQEEAKRYLLEI